jgi:hypothetical protein
MSYFVVIREAGAAWAAGGITEQPAVGDHTTFMNASCLPDRSPDPSVGACVCY